MVIEPWYVKKPMRVWYIKKPLVRCFVRVSID
jgi:hypothetical protein